MANTPEAAPQSKKHFHIPQFVRRILVFLLVVLIALTAWTYRAYLTPEYIRNWVQTNLLGYTDGDGFPVSLGSNTVNRGNLTVENGTPAVVGKTAYLHLSGGGKTLALRQHGYTNPVLTRNKNRFLLYDLGGKSFRVSENGTDFTETAQYDYSIYCGAIAANGSYAIVSASNGYTSQVTVFDRNGQKLFTWASQNYLINAIAFSADSSKIVATAFTSDKGELLSCAMVFSLHSSEPLISYDLGENAALAAVFIDNDTVLTVGDTATVRLQISDEKSTVYNYNGRVLSAYDLNQNGALLALSASADGRNGTLVHLNTALKSTDILRFSQALDSVQLSEAGVVTLSNGTVALYDDHGTRLESIDAGSDALCAKLSNGTCFVLGVSEIRAFSFQNALRTESGTASVA